MTIIATERQTVGRRVDPRIDGIILEKMEKVASAQHITNYQQKPNDKVLVKVLPITDSDRSQL